MVQRLGVFTAVLLLALPAFCQSRAALDEFVQNWKMSKEFTLAVAELMPAEHYSFKPNPEEFSFGELMLHIAGAQAFRFAQVAGVKAPLERADKADKETALRLLKQSFDFCIDLLPKFTPEQLDRMYKVDWYQRPEVTGRQLILGMFVHTAHHRGQAEVYLRVKNIKPPAYRF